MPAFGPGANWGGATAPDFEDPALADRSSSLLNRMSENQPFLGHLWNKGPVGPFGRSAESFGPTEQRFEDSPLSVGEVGRVARWEHGGLWASGFLRTSACYSDARW